MSTALRFKPDPRHSLGSSFHRTLLQNARMDDIISCQVSIKSYCSLFAMANSKSNRFTLDVIAQLRMLLLNNRSRQFTLL